MTREEYTPDAYWTALLARQLDQSGVGYPGLSVSFNRAMYRALTRQVARVLGSRGLLSPPPEAVLDVGSGTGVWIDFWRRQGARRIAGIDLTAASVATLRKLHPGVEMHVGDVADGVPGGPYDAISAMSVLLHVTDDARWRRALANLEAVLAPGGFIVLVEPLVVHRWWGPPFGPESNSVARPRAVWDAALDEAGLRLDAVRPATVLLANPADTRHAVSFRALERYWRALSLVVGRRERLGAALGTPIELLDRPLRRAMPHGPTAKVLVLRRR